MRTLRLSIHQFSMSPRQIALLLRHGEEVLPLPPAIQEIEKQNQSKAFSLEAAFISSQIKLHLSTDILYRGEDNFIERWIYREKEKPFHVLETNFLAHLIHQVVRANNIAIRGVRTVHHIFSEIGQLLRRYSITEELSTPHQTELFIQEKLTIIAENLHLPDADLAPCHGSYRGRYEKNCFHECPVRRHCSYPGRSATL